MTRKIHIAAIASLSMALHLRGQSAVETTQPLTQPPAQVVSEVAAPPSQRGWVGFEYWGLWSGGSKTPALLTLSAPGTPRAGAGVLGTPGTTVLFGDDGLGGDYRSGFAVNFGWWLDPCNAWALAGDVFYVSPNSVRYRSPDPASGAIVSRPFDNALTGQPDAQLVNYPGVLSGVASVDYGSEIFGGGLGLRRRFAPCDPCPTSCVRRTVDLTVGYRAFVYDEDLTIREDLTTVDPQGLVPPGTRILIEDSFRVQNQFHGVNLGVASEWQSGCWFWGVQGSAAVGVNIARKEISGSTTVVDAGGDQARSDGGLLTAASNIGASSTTHFAVLPALGLRFGYEWSPSFRTYAGYQILYLSNVTRVGDLIDTSVNPNLLPPSNGVGPARPQLAGKTSDLWLHGFTVGGEVRF